MARGGEQSLGQRVAMIVLEQPLGAEVVVEGNERVVERRHQVVVGAVGRVDELAATIERFRKHFESSGERRKKHIEHWKNRLIEMLESRLLERVLGGKNSEARLEELAAAVAEREKDPFSAVAELLHGTNLS